MLETLIATGKKAKQLKASYWSLLKEEILFYFKFKEMEKQVVYSESSEHSQSQEKKEEGNFDWTNKEYSLDTLASNHSNRSKRSRRSRSLRSQSRSRRSRSGKKRIVKQNSDNSCWNWKNYFCRSFKFCFELCWNFYSNDEILKNLLLKIIFEYFQYFIWYKLYYSVKNIAFHKV